eukprot:scaffold35083_cov37-Prasinocladus_malaysianus.AAC.1
MREAMRSNDCEWRLASEIIAPGERHMSRSHACVATHNEQRHKDSKSETSLRCRTRTNPGNELKCTRTSRGSYQYE